MEREEMRRKRRGGEVEPGRVKEGNEDLLMNNKRESLMRKMKIMIMRKLIYGKR